MGSQQLIFKNFSLKIYRFGILIKIQIFWHLSSFAFGKKKKKNLVFNKKQVIRELYLKKKDSTSCLKGYFDDVSASE